ncbi:MAG: cytochrome c [bacterium]|nr:cytochrome c [bacterium]
MNWWIILAVVAVMLAARWRKAGMLAWAVAWLLGMWVAMRYGFVVPVPASVIKIYMGIVVLSLIAYVLTDKDRIAEFWGPIEAFVTEPRYRLLLAATVLLIPAAVAYQIYAGMTAIPNAPFFARTVHPAPPDSITVHGSELALGTADNPYRELEETSPEEFEQRLENGRKIYFQNCFYCHGDLMGGAGMYAHALNPIPTNFQDPGTIAMFREAFLFWRISKGAPGLPEEGGPWQSAMPAWESFLTEEEMWDVIIFLYDFTDYKPRAVEMH